MMPALCNTSAVWNVKMNNNSLNIVYFPRLWPRKMTLPGCQRNARCLLLAVHHYGGFRKGLGESVALSCHHLRRNEAISAQHLYRHVFTMQNPPRNRWLPRAGCARYISEDGVKVIHPENNPPPSIQKQESAVVPREDVETFLEGTQALIWFWKPRPLHRHPLL